jgi:gliding motility-associated-like protein
MKKIPFLLLSLLMFASLPAAAQCDATIENLTVEPASDNEPPFNQYPSASTGDMYVGSAPLTLTFSVESSSANLRWRQYDLLTPGVDTNIPIDSNPQSVTHTFADSGTYMIVVEVIGEEGCESVKDSVQVQVSTSKLEVPNVFSPNNDGQNDQFCVAYQSLSEYQCFVYNRWGREVFHSDNPALCWDGRIGGGQPADIGAYYYVIQAKGADGVKHKRGGDINLVR